MPTTSGTATSGGNVVGGVVVVVVLLVVVVVGAVCGVDESAHDARRQAPTSRAQQVVRRPGATPQIMAERRRRFWPPGPGIGTSVARAPSLTHDLVVLGQDNGELQEDVMERSLAASGSLDAEIDASFPASDPLSHWAGPRRLGGDADRRHGSLVHRRPVEDVSERQRPEQPVPGTLGQ